jgi:hypothetical protein
MPDRLIWTDAPNDNYNVKMGYNNLMEATYRVGDSELQAYWNTIWGLDLISRVKLFFREQGIVPYQC